METPAVTRDQGQEEEEDIKGEDQPPALKYVGPLKTLVADLATTCAGCGTKKGNLYACAGCRVTHFCSKACQKGNWKTGSRHSGTCGTLAKTHKLLVATINHDHAAAASAADGYAGDLPEMEALRDMAAFLSLSVAKGNLPLVARGLAGIGNEFLTQESFATLRCLLALGKFATVVFVVDRNTSGFFARCAMHGIQTALKSGDHGLSVQTMHAVVVGKELHPEDKPLFLQHPADAASVLFVDTLDGELCPPSSFGKGPVLVISAWPEQHTLEALPAKVSEIGKVTGRHGAALCVVGGASVVLSKAFLGPECLEKPAYMFTGAFVLDGLQYAPAGDLPGTGSYGKVKESVSNTLVWVTPKGRSSLARALDGALAGSGLDIPGVVRRFKDDHGFAGNARSFLTVALVFFMAAQGIEIKDPDDLEKKRNLDESLVLLAKRCSGNLWVFLEQVSSVVFPAESEPDQAEKRLAMSQAWSEAITGFNEFVVSHLFESGTNVCAASANPLSAVGKWLDKREGCSTRLQALEGVVQLAVYSLCERMSKFSSAPEAGH